MQDLETLRFQKYILDEFDKINSKLDALNKEQKDSINKKQIESCVRVVYNGTSSKVLCMKLYRILSNCNLLISRVEVERIISS